MPYLIEFEGQTFNTDDLTVNEAIAIEEDTGLSWRYLSPYNSAKHWKAIVLAFLARDKGPDGAKAYLDEYCGGVGSLDAAVGSIKAVEDDRPTLYDDGLPKAEDDPGTDGSSGASSTGDGPPTPPEA